MVGHLHGVPVLVYPPDGIRLGEQEVLDVIGAAFAHRAELVSLPARVSRPAAGSGALRDFISEANRGDQIWFVPTRDELAERLRRFAARRTAG